MYVAVDVYWFVLENGLVVFWAMMARPGRRRCTRLAFAHPADAAVYGLVLAERYEKSCLAAASLPRKLKENEHPDQSIERIS